MRLAVKVRAGKPIFKNEIFSRFNVGELIYAAEAQLKEYQQRPEFSVFLLKMLTHASVDPGVKLAAAIMFKNIVKQNWVRESCVFTNYSRSMQHFKFCNEFFFHDVLPPISAEVWYLTLCERKH
jgi:hypothetical protein